MYLRAKFEVCSIVLSSFRQGVRKGGGGGGGWLYSPPPQNELLKNQPTLGLKDIGVLLPIFRDCYLL